MKDQSASQWPILHFEELEETITTVHLWTQIIGKIRLENMPWLNHSWHVTLYISPRGLTTGSIPYGDEIFQIDFDFINHELIIVSSSGRQERLALQSRSVASFYEETFRKLKSMGIEVNIHSKPNEMVEAIPFEQDVEDRTYDANSMNLLWRAFIKADIVFNRFRARFTGKASPVHFFWGSFDLAVTRFSGRPAPKHPGGAPNMPDRVMQEAYSHEVSSCGFWPGNSQSPVPVFYSYCYPTPADFGKQPAEPADAFFNEEMGEFFLPYDSVQSSPDPEATLMRFLMSTYQAAAKTGNWDVSLECNLSYLKNT